MEGSNSNTDLTRNTSAGATDTMEGFSLSPDGGVGGVVSAISSPSASLSHPTLAGEHISVPESSLAYLDSVSRNNDDRNDHGLSDGGKAIASSSRIIENEVPATAATRAVATRADDEDLDNTFHFGPTNPLGPVDGGGKTTKTTFTSDSQRIRQDTGETAAAGADDSGRSWTHTTHTTVWTTILPDGRAYRTTRVVGLSRKRHTHNIDHGGGEIHKHRLATATPLATTYEQTHPFSGNGTELITGYGGPTQRVIHTYHQPYDGSYVRTSELIRGNGGATTVRKQKFTRSGVPEGRETTLEYPPMEISPRTSSSNRNSSSAEDGTIISEVTNTLAGNTASLDPTSGPSIIDYNAGYSPEVAAASRKHPGEDDGYGAVTAAAMPTINDLYLASGPDGASSRPQQTKIPAIAPEGGGWSIGTENYSVDIGNEADPSFTIDPHRPTDFISCSSRSSWSRRRRARYLKWAAVCLVIAGALAIGATVGAIMTRKGGGGDESSSSADISASSDGGGVSNGGGDGREGNTGILSPPTEAPSVLDGDSKPTLSPTSTNDVFAKAGFGRQWPSEDGWIIAPSYASFTASNSDVFRSTPPSYYDSFYLPDAASCADKCTALDAVGGAYFDLSSQNKRNVCLCYKEAECYDPSLQFSGGVVFLKEEHYIPPEQVCLMSTCGYFPEDPICDGLGIVGVEAMVDLELRKIVGLMEARDIQVFEKTCADFLNDRFSQSDSPVEGVRCQVVRQDVAGRRGRRRGRNLQKAEDKLELSLRVTGLFVPTRRFPDVESVDFGNSVSMFFDRNEDEFIAVLMRDAETSGTDYYENMRGISIMGNAIPVPVPTPPPVNPTKEPSMSPTPSPSIQQANMPVPWPTTEPPSRRPTRRPTRAPVPWPTNTNPPSDKPTRKPTPRPSRKPTFKPTRQPTRKVTPRPTRKPSRRPTPRPTPKPSKRPTPKPTKPAPIPVPSPDPPDPSSSSLKFCLGTDCWVQIGKTLKAKELGEQLGDGVQLDDSGSRFSVSASMSSESNRKEAGYVKVYDVVGEEFVQVGQTLYGFDPGDEVKGKISGNGKRLVMHTTKRDNNTGRVWIYELRSGKKWVEIRRIIGQNEGEKFGKSVAMSTEGDIIAVGAPFANGDRGEVRVYREKGGSWRQMGQDLRGLIKDGKFGWKVALSTDTLRLAVGQKSDDNGEDTGRSGQVRVFQFSSSDPDDKNGNFEPFGDPIEGDNEGDDFGRAVAISASGSIVAAGARYHNGNGKSDSGQVKVFSLYGGDAWLQTPYAGSDIVGEGKGDEMMNVALTAQGHRIAAGGGSGNDDTGYVYVYDNRRDQLKQVGGKLEGSKKGQKFGSNFSLSSDGTRLLVGSPARDNNDVRTSVQLFELRSERDNKFNRR